MSQTKISNLMKQKPLTPNEMEVTAGCLIGDGTLSSSGKQYRLRVEHKMEHKEYVMWKYIFLNKVCIASPQYVPQHSSFRFGTVGHPQITSLRQIWYRPEKQIPANLVLTPLMIAIWFMDDGTRHRDSIDISIHNFSDQSVNSLVHQLTVSKIKTTVNNDSKGKRLYVQKKSYPIFKKLVKPYIVKCMAYKLP